MENSNENPTPSQFQQRLNDLESKLVKLQSEHDELVEMHDHNVEVLTRTASAQDMMLHVLLHVIADAVVEHNVKRKADSKNIDFEHYMDRWQQDAVKQEAAMPDAVQQEEKPVIFGGDDGQASCPAG